MNVLVLGSGGREHAIARSCHRSPSSDLVYVAPGNPGMKMSPGIEVVSDLGFDCGAIEIFCVENKIDLVIVGPEGPLSNGLVDELKMRSIVVLGPTAAAARLESSKAFAKKFMQKYEIPTARFKTCQNLEQAQSFLQTFEPNSKVVVKASGLAAGKGVFICENPQNAFEHCQQILGDDPFVVKDRCVVIEEFLEGRELSLFVLSDGHNHLSLGTACDYKRLFWGNKGPNTGGMGAITPKDWPSKAQLEEIETRIVATTIKGMEVEGHPFQGVLYFGLMLTDRGPEVIEYNVRFGDPEAQVILPLIKSDMTSFFYKTALGALDLQKGIDLDQRYGLHIVMTSQGYANLEGREMTLGGAISFGDADFDNIFFSGVNENEKGQLVNSGGRVLGVTVLAENLEDARIKAYQQIENISFKGAYWRDDIGLN